MGHDHHFLSRLDRVDLRDAETALELYRDHDLVRVLLQVSSAPQTAERVAISLDHPVEGPFIIVARDGHFVTCLGRGMHVKHPVITRREFDAISTHGRRLRQAAQSIAERKDGRSLLERALQRGEMLLSEDLTELRVVLPLIEAEVARSALNLGGGLMELLPKMQRALKIKGANARRAAAAYTRALWQYRNHLVLLGMSSAHFKEKALESMIETLTFPSLDVGLNFAVQAAAWLSAQIGPSILDRAFARVHNEDACVSLDGLLAICAIASRHPECRPRAKDFLKNVQLEGTSPVAGLTQAALAMLEAHEEGTLRSSVYSDSQKQVFEAAAELYPEAKGPEDIPEQEAFTWGLQASFHVVQSSDTLVSSFMLAVLAAELEAEQLCLPKRMAEFHMTKFDPVVSADLIAGVRRDRSKPRPIKVAAAPSRNDPCPCGSGLKYKKCCLVKETV